MSGLFGSAPASGTTDRSGSNDRSDTADRSVPDRGVGMSGAAGGPTGDRAAGDPAGESSRPAERPATSASIGRPGSADAGEGGRGGRDDSPSGTAAAAGSGAAARGGADTPGPRGIGPARPAAPSAAASPALPAGGSARGRAPLPGPPPSMRPLGPPLPPGPRYSSAAPRRRMLSGAERGKLTMLAVVLTLGGALLSYLVAAVLPSTYAARTTIQYNIAGENTGDFLKTDRNLTTQVVLLTSRSVLQPVADSNGINVDDLTKQVSASILSSSDIIQLQVNSSSPDTAVSLANGIAKQYLTVANNGGGRGYLESQLAGVRKQQSSSPYGTTAADTAALATRAAALQAQLDQMNLTQNMSSVLTPAYALSQPVSPNQSLAGFAGGLSGLVIALMTVVVLTRRWTRP
jgi:capsular polysaccharide biosynthesis protein